MACLMGHGSRPADVQREDVGDRAIQGRRYAFALAEFHHADFGWIVCRGDASNVDRLGAFHAQAFALHRSKVTAGGRPAPAFSAMGQAPGTYADSV